MLVSAIAALLLVATLLVAAILLSGLLVATITTVGLLLVAATVALLSVALLSVALLLITTILLLGGTTSCEATHVADALGEATEGTEALADSSETAIATTAASTEERGKAATAEAEVAANGGGLKSVSNLLDLLLGLTSGTSLIGSLIAHALSSCETGSSTTNTADGTRREEAAETHARFELTSELASLELILEGHATERGRRNRRGRARLFFFLGTFNLGITFFGLNVALNIGNFDFSIQIALESKRKIVTSDNLLVKDRGNDVSNGNDGLLVDGSADLNRLSLLGNLNDLGLLEDLLIKDERFRDHGSGLLLDLIRRGSEDIST